MTRALIRGEEIIAEPFSQWVESHLDWMCGREIGMDGNPIPGDGWTLVENYVPQYDVMGRIIIPEPEPEPEPEETFELNGRTYTRSELLELLK